MFRFLRFAQRFDQRCRPGIVNCSRRRFRSDILDKMRIIPGQHFYERTLSFSVGGAGVRDLTISHVQFTGAAFVRPHLDRNIARRGEGQESNIVEREVAQCPTRHSCFHPRAEKRLHGRAEFHQLERFFEKLQRAISSAFRRQFRSNPGRDEQDTRLGQNTTHFAEERDRTRIWRVEVENDEFGFLFEGGPPRFRQRSDRMKAMMRREFR